MAKKLKMSELFTKEAYGEGGLTAEERRRELKIQQALEYSGWRPYGTTASKLIQRIPEEWWEKYTAKHIGETMAMLKRAFDDGVNFGREHND